MRVRVEHVDVSRGRPQPRPSNALDCEPVAAMQVQRVADCLVRLKGEIVDRPARQSQQAGAEDARAEVHRVVEPCVACSGDERRGVGVDPHFLEQHHVEVVGGREVGSQRRDARLA
eukprot:362868-Chlamydomonas_euryale.AAC.6